MQGRQKTVNCRGAYSYIRVNKLAQSSVNRTPCSFLPARLQNSFYLTPVTSNETENEILKLNCTNPQDLLVYL